MSGHALAIDVMLHALRVGDPVRDAAFDAIYPPHIRCVSSTYWTPVAVARLATELLADGSARVLDIGAGVGKLCLVGALTTSASYVGLEHRPELVQIARETTDRLGIERCDFRCDTLENVPWQDFDAFYLFNPFGENLQERIAQLDGVVELSQGRFARDIALVERGLAGARVGTRVVTYHGFGGGFPSSYRLLRRTLAGTDVLRLWVKVHDSNNPRVSHLELGHGEVALIRPAQG